MVMLNATEVQDESEIAHEDEQIEAADAHPNAYRIRRVTLEVPSEAETSVVLLAQESLDGRWRSGFEINRAYDPAPHDQAQTDTPSEPADDDGFDTIGEAVCDGCNRANWWISIQAADDDLKARAVGDFLDAWLAEFEPETAGESIFDDGPECEEMADLVAAEEAAAMPNVEKVVDTMVAEVMAVVDQATQPKDGKPIGYTVTEEAQRHYDDRKRALEARIGLLAIEQVNLKAAAKANREALTEYTEELESHLSRGPEQLPLFDREKKANVVETVVGVVPQQDEQPRDLSQNEACQVANRVVEQEQANQPEPWRSMKMADLDGLTPKIVEILDGERITTIGEWVDWPAQHPGLEYTQIKNAAGGLTEKRYEKVADAVNAAVTKAA